MADLTHLFKVGQHVKYKNEDFDAVNKFVPCIVKETYPDHIIITDTETNTDLWCEEKFNMDCVFPDYNECVENHVSMSQEHRRRGR